MHPSCVVHTLRMNLLTYLLTYLLATQALQQGEVLIYGQPVQINPAFMRGARPPDSNSTLTLPLTLTLTLP